MVVDNFPSAPGCSLYTNQLSLDFCWYDGIGEFSMDPFFFEEAKEIILAVAADSSTSSQHLAVPQNPPSTNHLDALNQCVQNMTSAMEILPGRSADTNIATRTPARSRSNRSGPRRNKANARERQRMHGLNGALDNLRRRAPIVSESQKLSKIETLRLTRNYIQLLSGMLNDEPAAHFTESSSIDMANVLTRGMSQATTNVIHSLLGVNNRSPISFVPPMRRDNDTDQTSDGLTHTRPQQPAYQLNDLLANICHAGTSFDPPQRGIQPDSGAGPYTQQEQPLSLDDTCWAPSEMWDSSSFDFDEPSIDF